MKKFTLIELLLVIAIIGILATILMPSLSRARDAAITKVCLANVKQIGLAYNMYLDDNDGIMPYTPYGDINTQHSWPTLLDSDAGGSFDYNNENWRDFAGRGASPVWRCPMTSGTPSGRSDRVDYGKSEHYPVDGDPNYEAQQGKPISNIAQPSSLMLIVDAATDGSQNNPWAWTEEQLTARNHDNGSGINYGRWNNYAAPRHIGFKKNNIGMFDGSARLNNHGDVNTPSIKALFYP